MMTASRILPSTHVILGLNARADLVCQWSDTAVVQSDHLILSNLGTPKPTWSSPNSGVIGLHLLKFASMRNDMGH
jgi:hypothetical protein